MENRRLIIIIASIAITATVAGFFAQQWWRTAGTLVLISPHAQLDNPTNISSTAATKRPDFTLPDIENKSRSISEWDGKVILINFWATWCPPCVREVPTLNKLNTDYSKQGFVVIGIAIDSLDAVIDFTDPMDLRYPLLIAEDQGIKLSQAFGNRLGILPYTIIVDRQGKITERHQGEISYQQVVELITPLL